jgi:DNA polymerase-3 subunit gamma/tau
VRELLGLADRSRIFDLLEAVLAGDAAAALSMLAALNRDGAEPGQVIADLAESVHMVTLIKAAGAASVDPAASEAERARAASLAERLKMPVLARAWQMLLKGHDEVRASPRPLAAADMVLVRLAYAADLPPPSELARAAREGQGEVRRDGAPRNAPSEAAAPRKPLPAEAMSKPEPVAASGSTAESMGEDQGPASFAGVVELAAQKRDLKLKHALLEQVRLVRFKPPTIEINLVAEAPRDLAQELMRKLKLWTGRVWIVAVSDEEGAPPLGVQRREQEAREIELVREHPAVKEVLASFPGAKISAVRPSAKPAQEASAAEELEQFSEDGTN